MRRPPTWIVSLLHDLGDERAIAGGRNVAVVAPEGRTRGGANAATRNGRKAGNGNGTKDFSGAGPMAIGARDWEDEDTPVVSIEEAIGPTEVESAQARLARLLSQQAEAVERQAAAIERLAIALRALVEMRRRK